MIRSIIKGVLSNLRLLNLARLIKTEIVYQQFKTVEVDYKGVQFPITGPAGDFAESIRSYGVYEPGLMDRVLKVVWEGMDILDIGAAEGFFSVFVSSIPNVKVNVVAFDGDDSRLRLFSRNMKRANTANVKLIRSYIGDGLGAHPSVDSFEIELKLNRIGMIKLDVEGEELFVLPGATGVIRKYRPHVFVEIHPAKILTIDENGIAKLMNWFRYIDMPMWLCPNHRGEHRGPVEPWRRVSARELADFIYSGSWKTVGNFYIHLDATGPTKK